MCLCVCVYIRCVRQQTVATVERATSRRQQLGRFTLLLVVSQLTTIFSISPSGSNFLETISDSVCVVQVSEVYHHGAQLCRNHQVTGFDSFQKKLLQFSQAILLTRESFEILPVIEFDQSPIGFVFHLQRVPIWTQGKIQLSSV